MTPPLPPWVELVALAAERMQHPRRCRDNFAVLAVDPDASNDVQEIAGAFVIALDAVTSSHDPMRALADRARDVAAFHGRHRRRGDARRRCRE